MKKRLHVVYTNLTKMQLKLLKQIVERNFKSSCVLSKNLSLKATHLVVGNKQNENIFTPKTILAILSNCKIVKFDWVMFIKNILKFFSVN